MIPTGYNDPEKVRVAAGQVFEDAIVTSSSCLTFIPQTCDDREEVMVTAGEVHKSATLRVMVSTQTISSGRSSQMIIRYIVIPIL